MSRIGTVIGDLRALGKSAPLRIAYETAKRSGAHGLALRSLTRHATPADLVAIPAFRPQGPLPAPAISRCLSDARMIVDEGHRAFGVRIPIAGRGDWNAVGKSGRCWPDDPFWWQIDIRTVDRIGDVKWTWELGRHRDLVVLARAAYLEPRGGWLQELAKRLRWWFEASPSERGIHWYSNLEIALRVTAWMQIYALCSESLPRDVVDTMALHVVQARRHLLVDFPYTVSSMRNNHLLGDSLGLLVIDKLTSHRHGRVSRMAEDAFAGQLARHMREDGSMIEDSLSYHRFVLEMLVIKFLLGDRAGATPRALRSSAEHLESLGVFDGELPQWGDWDEGRVLASSGDACDLAGSTALALQLTGGAWSSQSASDYDEVAWYSASSADDSATGQDTLRQDSGQISTVTTSGGITFIRSGDWRVWLKHGTGPSHQHADLTHVSARMGGRWVFVDPGTGTYNGDLEIRNAFRTSGSHNGLRTAGAEMFEPHRAFRWLTGARVTSGQPLRAAETVIAWCIHDAYARTEGGGLIARAVLVDPNGVTVIDWRQDGQDARLTVALPPEAVASPHGVRVADETSLFLAGFESCRIVEGVERPFAGSFSATYGRWRPAPWLEQTVTGRGATYWGVSVAEFGERPKIEGSQVTIGGVKLRLNFVAQGAALELTTGGRVRTHLARLENQ